MTEALRQENRFAMREALLHRIVRSVSERWAEAFVEDGAAESSGFPGTVSQARSRLRAVIFVELARARLTPAVAVEIERCTSAVYELTREMCLDSR